MHLFCCLPNKKHQIVETKQLTQTEATRGTVIWGQPKINKNKRIEKTLRSPGENHSWDKPFGGPRENKKNNINR
jgi:hypothetical protein